MKWLSKEEREKLRNWLKSDEKSQGKYKDYHKLFIAIAYESGLRLTEIIGGWNRRVEKSSKTWTARWIKGLTHAQANIESGIWESVKRLKRKDGVSKNTILGPITKKIYQEMFTGEEDRNERVFKNGPVANSIYRFCARLGTKIGIEGFSPHRLRHTVGREMAEGGARPEEIQEILGHKVGATSLIYCQSTSEEAINVLRNIRRNDDD